MLPAVVVMLGLIAGMLGGSATADTIRLRADEWCPYNCEPGSDRPGYMIEIAREVLEGAGHRVDYATLNWQRSIEETRLGRFDGIIGAVVEEAPDFVFPASLGRSSDGYVMRRGATFRTDGPEALDGLVVGAIRGYEYGDPVGAYIEANQDDPQRVQLLAGDSALSQNLRKLVTGRVDLVVDDVNRLRLFIDSLGLREQAEIVHQDEANDLFIAFSPANPRSVAYAELLSAGVESLRASGRLASILDRYGLRDWR